MTNDFRCKKPLAGQALRRPRRSRGMHGASMFDAALRLGGCLIGGSGATSAQSPTDELHTDTRHSSRANG